MRDILRTDPVGKLVPLLQEQKALANGHSTCTSTGYLVDRAESTPDCIAVVGIVQNPWPLAPVCGLDGEFVLAQTNWTGQLYL